MHPQQPHTRGAFETTDPIEQDSARPEPRPRRNQATGLLVLAALVLAAIVILAILI
jgi:hypothetical protein